MTEAPEVNAASLARLKRRYRWRIRWTVGRPNRTWVIFASAPGPVLPSPWPEAAVLVCINNAGRTAEALGLPRPDITIRAEAKSWSEIAGLSSRVVLWISSIELRRQRRRRPESREHRVRFFLRITPEDRDSVNRAIFGPSPQGHEGRAKPSNGLFAVALALLCGANRVVISGMSLTELGHSYNDALGQRMHVEEDTEALRTLAAQYPQVSTSEPRLAELTGLPLYS